jgi:RNA polymerase primary sigma factor
MEAASFFEDDSYPDEPDTDSELADLDYVGGLSIVSEDGEAIEPDPEAPIEVIDEQAAIPSSKPDSRPDNASVELDLTESKASTVDPLKIFLRDIGKIPLLTKEEEVDLAKDIELGNQAAKQHMIEANLRLVVSVAKGYQHQGLDLFDLIQEGTLGLMRAIEKFDYRRGFTLSTYAVDRIKDNITRALANKSRNVRIPVHVVARMNAVRATSIYLTSELGREPTHEEISEWSSLSTDQVKEAQQFAQTPTSLNKSVGEEDSSTTLADMIKGSDGDEGLEAAAHNYRLKALHQALHGRRISSKERDVLRLRYGLGDDSEPRTLKETGKILNVTGSRVQQIEVRVLKKLAQTTRLKQAVADD